MATPNVEVVKTYLRSAGVSWSDEDVASAFAAEVDDQSNKCRIPTDTAGDPDYPPALIEALNRRVAHNLAVRPLPLGVQATVTDAAALNTYVGGLDAEVRRFEGPFRKRIVG